MKATPNEERALNGAACVTKNSKANLLTTYQYKTQWPRCTEPQQGEYLTTLITRTTPIGHNTLQNILMPLLDNVKNRMIVHKLSNFFKRQNPLYYVPFSVQKSRV